MRNHEFPRVQVSVVCPLCGKPRTVRLHENRRDEVYTRPCRTCSNRQQSVKDQCRDTKRKYKEHLARQYTGKDRDTAIIELYSQQTPTLSLEQVGEILHMSAQTIRRDLIELGVKRRPRGGANNVKENNHGNR